MYKKTDVVEFVLKVKVKAIKAIDAEYSKQFDAAVDEFMAQPEYNYLHDLFADYTEAVKQLDKAIGELNYFMVSMGLSSKGAHPLYNHASHNIKETVFNFFQELHNRYAGSPALQTDVAKIWLKWYATKQQVIREYGKTLYLVKSASTAKKGRAILDSLGFDTSYLDRITPPAEVPVATPDYKVDKSALFPCGEAGLE